VAVPGRLARGLTRTHIHNERDSDMKKTPKIALRSFQKDAKDRWGAEFIIEIVGDGPWAVAMTCPRGLKIHLFRTREEAEGAKRWPCGGQCCGPAYHVVECLFPPTNPWASPEPTGATQ